MIEPSRPPRAEFVIDRRPLWKILLAASQPFFMILVGVGLYAAVYNMPTPEGLKPEGQKALAVFSLCVFFWVFDVLPLMITSLLAIILIPLSGVMSTGDTYKLFGNEAVFFILGVFILAACLMQSGLSSRIAIALLERFGRTPRTLLISVLVVNAVMSFAMSEHAVAAMNFPIVLEIVAVLKLNPRKSRYGKALFLAMAWGTTIGGVATLLGGGRGPLALEILRKASGKTFTFLEWSIAILPLVLALLFLCYFVLIFFFPIDITSVKAADDILRQKRNALGRTTYREKVIAAVMTITLIGWVVGGEEFGLANIALAAVISLFALQIVQWRTIEGYVNWGIILMYGGAICLGAAINQSGAAAWIAQVTVSKWALGGPSVVLILSFMAILLTEAMSNSAVVALLMPVSLGVAAQFDLDPKIMALVVAVPAGLGYTLPIGTPANAIAYSSGHLSIRDMVVPGFIMAVSSWLLFNLVANFYWPLIGLHL